MDRQMKTLRRVIALCIVLGLACGIVILQKNNREHAVLEQALQQEQESTLMALAEAEIQQITFDGNDGPLTFVNKDGVWSSPSDADFVMARERIELLLGDLAQLISVRELQDVTDLAAYGLAPAANTIEVTKTDGETLTLTLGSRNGSTKEYYVQTEAGSGTVYMVENALAEHFSGSLADFAEFEDYPHVNAQGVTRMQVQRADADFTLLVDEDKDWYVEEEGAKNPANLTAITTAANDLANISWKRHVEYACKDFAHYGLDEPQAVISFTYTADYKPCDMTLSIGNADEQGHYYVRKDDSPQVNVVRAEYLEDFLNNRGVAYWRLAYGFTSIGDLKTLDVTRNGETHQLSVGEIQGGSELAAQWMVDGKSVEKKLFTDFYYDCVSLSAEKRLEELVSDKGEPIMTLLYNLNDGTTREVAYYNYDNNYYYVEYDDHTIGALTNKLYINAIFDKYEALLNAAG